MGQGRVNPCCQASLSVAACMLAVMHGLFYGACSIPLPFKNKNQSRKVENRTILSPDTVLQVVNEMFLLGPYRRHWQRE